MLGNELYEYEYTRLKDLTEGDKYLTKGNTECVYMYPLGDDKHRVYNLDGEPYDVPHGNFPIFKYKGDE